MAWPPTLYKARGIGKQHVCAICVDRTRGRTRRVELGYGVAVWLCPAHADQSFLRRRSGRDLVLTLKELWQAHGCYTVPRRRALEHHLDLQTDAGRRHADHADHAGSYAWPQLRRDSERRFAGGAALADVAHDIQKRFPADMPARPPSLTTLKRWRRERRWLTRPDDEQPP